MKRVVSKIQHDDIRINLIQDRILEALNNVLALPIIDSDLIQGIAVVSGANTINHKLGRKLRGWIPTRNSASITLYDTQATNPLPDKTLQLVASGSATIDLMVF